MFSCSERPPAEQAIENALQGGKLPAFTEIPTWLGVYQDTLPCPDCIGILTRLDLHRDSTYKLSSVYLGKEPIFDHTFSWVGHWTFDTISSNIWLDSAKDGKKLAFAVVADSMIQMCDEQGKAINAANYKLQRL